MRCLFIVLLVLSFPPPSAARDEEPSDAELARGITLVQEGDYGRAIMVLDAAATRLDARGRTREAARAYFHLGTAHVAENQESLAAAAFRKALDRDEAMELTVFDVSPRVREAFERARRERRQDQLAARKGGGGSKALLIAGGLLAAGGGAAVALAGAGGDDGGDDGASGGTCPGPELVVVSSTLPSGSRVSVADTTTLTLRLVPPKRSLQASGFNLEIALRESTSGANCYVLPTLSLTSDGRCTPIDVNVPLAFREMIATQALCRPPFRISNGNYFLTYTGPDTGRTGSDFAITFDIVP